MQNGLLYLLVLSDEMVVKSSLFKFEIAGLDVAWHATISLRFAF